MPSSGHEGQWKNDGVSPDLERTAADWFFRRDRGLTAAENEAFACWLTEDDRHARALAEIENTWRALAETQDKVMPFVPPPATALRRNRRSAWISGVLAAAALVTLSLLGWWRLANDSLAFTGQVATETGGLRRMELPDGTAVMLNRDSRISVNYTTAERKVWLIQGEAHFAVARNPNRPFVVQGRGVAVKAVGTAFNVRLSPEAVEVIVTAGKVRVDDADGGRSLVAMSSPPDAPMVVRRDERHLLLAGEKIMVPVNQDVRPQPATAAMLAGDEIDRALAWQKLRLEYVDAPLSEIVADFNRHNQHRLVIADPRLGERRFGGSFPAGDYDSLVQLLETTFGVRIDRRKSETVLRLP